MQNTLVLASLRTDNNLTLSDIAHVLNVSLSSYKLYETGIVPISLEELNLLSTYYDVSFDYILGFTKNKKRTHFRKSIDYRYLRFAVRYLRKMYRLSQKDLAKAFGVSLYSISKYEHDGTKINLTYLYLIAQKFNISSDYLCGKSFKKEVL